MAVPTARRIDRVALQGAPGGAADRETAEDAEQNDQSGVGEGPGQRVRVDPGEGVLELLHGLLPWSLVDCLEAASRHAGSCQAAPVIMP
jgi:hypothetical protein